MSKSGKKNVGATNSKSDFFKNIHNELSSGVRNPSSTVTSKIISLRPSQNVGAQRVVKRVVYQSGTPGLFL